jgi:molecular chaperone IbpA
MTTVTYTNSWPSKSSVWGDLFMIGFDKIWNNTVVNTGFPFYNVEKVNSDEYLVEIALAGFAREDVDIKEHNSSLIITGNQKGIDNKNYLYKGISNKSFTRSFALADHVHVKDAVMENGMLSITLKRDIPEEAKPKHIAIKAA